MNDLPDPKMILQNDRNTQIGNLCVQWAHLEYLLVLCVGSLLRIDEHSAKIVAGGLNIRSRAKLAWDLAIHLNAPSQAVHSLKKTHDKISKLDDRRNRAVHGHRLTDPTRLDAETFEIYRGKGIGNRVRQTNKDLANLGGEVADVAKSLHEAMLTSGVFHVSTAKPAQIVAPE